MEQNKQNYIDWDNVSNSLSDEQNKRMEQIFDSYFSHRKNEKWFDELQAIDDFRFMIKNKKVPWNHADLQKFMDQLNDQIFSWSEKELENLSIIIHKDITEREKEKQWLLERFINPIPYSIWSEVYMPEINIIGKKVLLSNEKVEEINNLSKKYYDIRSKNYRNKWNDYMDNIREEYIDEIINNCKLSIEIKDFRSKRKNTYNNDYTKRFWEKILMLYDFFYKKWFYFWSTIGWYYAKWKDLVEFKEIKKVNISNYKIFSDLFWQKNIWNEIIIHILPWWWRNFTQTDDAYVDEAHNTWDDTREEEQTGIKIKPEIMEECIAMHEWMHSLLSKLYEKTKTSKNMYINSEYINWIYNHNNIDEMLASIIEVRFQYNKWQSIQHFHMKLQEWISNKLDEAIWIKEESAINRQFISKFKSSWFWETYSMTQEFAYNKFLKTITMDEKKILINKIKELRVLALATKDSNKIEWAYAKYEEKNREIRMRVKDIVESKIDKKSLINDYTKLWKICIWKLENQ